MAKVLLQVIRGWNHDGLVLQVGDRVSIDERAVNQIIRTGYARRVAADEAYEYPAEDSKDQFQKITFDEPEPDIEPDAIDELPPEIIPTKKVPRIESLDFIFESHRRALEKVEIITIADLEGWDISRMAAIKGISYSTAEKLLDAYSMFASLDFNKEDGLGIIER